MEYAFLIVCEYVWVYIGEFQRGVGKKEWEEEEEEEEKVGVVVCFWGYTLTRIHACLHLGSSDVVIQRILVRLSFYSAKTRSLVASLVSFLPKD